MKIDITDKTTKEVSMLSETYPDGYIHSQGSRVFWVFERE